MVEGQVVFGAASIVISGLALLVSVAGYLRSKQDKSVELTQVLHSSLFSDAQLYKVLYTDKTTHSWHFDSDTRGAPGNFVGSEEEPTIDLFLERLNLACMWLLKRRGGAEDQLFRKYIHRIYTSAFFCHYFSFLANAASVSTTGEYYAFLHRYAHRRLKLPRPRTSFPTTPSAPPSPAP